jgi:hypothetical protein
MPVLFVKELSTAPWLCIVLVRDDSSFSGTLFQATAFH